VKPAEAKPPVCGGSCNAQDFFAYRFAFLPAEEEKKRRGGGGLGTFDIRQIAASISGRLHPRDVSREGGGKREEEPNSPRAEVEAPRAG